MKSVLEVFTAVSLPFPSWGKESEAVGRAGEQTKQLKVKTLNPRAVSLLTSSPMQKGKHQSSQPS